jgi:hypothetical protein
LKAEIIKAAFNFSEDRQLATKTLSAFTEDLRLAISQFKAD